MIALPADALAYCGTPPDPAEIWTRWRFDPVVIVALVALAATYAIATRRSSTHAATSSARVLQSAAFYAGWAIATLALVSPLCALSVSLFVARATQHILLTMMAAPLIALGLRIFASGRMSIARPHAWIVASPLIAAFVFAGVVWFWHSPFAYASTFSSVGVYWAMHVTMFAAACWLWARLFDSAHAVGEGVLASVLSTVQMGFLGALITLSPRALYAPHFLTTDVWDLTPLQDQQLGGIVMWVFGCVAFLIVTIAMLARTLRERGLVGRLASARVRS